ncbi:MAG: hypothetical protein KKH20_11620 [Proteobacteria bacterium]|nr:hypothetical protein [Desulfobacteraceae bacterium]MBU4068073.1 hypothetical protein [Pseudomonadota bacterium]MBU4102003.1 hypothetical protein [Pseudomonadota bacterium]MBU4126794.1 hypothetical protein [Pseudomonadota bacterium]
MNDPQTIFTILFGVYFATTVALTGKFQPFDTPAMWRRDGYAWFRFSVSFISLNILPLLYLTGVLKWLSDGSHFSTTFWPMLALLMLSLAGFGFYRIYFGIMLLKWNNTYIFYGEQLPKALKQDLDERSRGHCEPFPHIIPGAIWSIVTISWGLVWIFWK